LKIADEKTDHISHQGLAYQDTTGYINATIGIANETVLHPVDLFCALQVSRMFQSNRQIIDWPIDLVY
jgi:hypothetical protein